MKSRITECLTAAGIQKVVWIDDFFATPSREQLIEGVCRFVLLLREQGREVAEIHPLSTLDLRKSPDTVSENCTLLIEDLEDKALSEITNQLALLSGQVENEGKSVEDLSASDFKLLKKAFGVALQTFSLGEWTSRGAQAFVGAKDDTIFFIDKEFTRESGSMDGIELLADLVTTTEAFCVMLTHTCSQGHEEERRVAFAAAKNLKPHRFSVLSKRQKDDLEVDIRFAQAIRAALVHRFCGEVAFKISQTIEESARKTAQELTVQSFSNLEQFLFENSTQEGVIEYDSVLRVFDIQQRHSLNQALNQSLVQDKLRLVRSFRQKTASIGKETVLPDMSYFRQLRQREIFSEGVGLNGLHAPLCCGDVFETNAGKKYLLLGQSCDLMVREDGKRRAEIGLMVLIEEANAAKVSESPHRYYSIDGVFENGKVWHVDFRNLFVADLSVLSLAAFNADGTVKLARNHVDPSIVLTKGWTKLFRRTKQQFFPALQPPIIPPLGLGKHAADLKGDLSSDVITYPLKRVGRIQSAMTTAILAAWATFQTRAALEHDFAKEKEVSEPCWREYCA